MKSQSLGFKDSTGFTLIELSIAMALLALMVTILYGVFYVAHRSVERWEARSEKSEKLRSLVDILGRYIRSAYPYRSSPRDPAVFFSGEEKQLTFVSAQSLGLGGRGMAKVSLTSDAEESGVLVLKEEIPAWTEGEVEGEGYINSIVLLREIKEFHIDYLDPKSEDENWLPTWDGSERRQLPRAVRLSHQGKQGKMKHWVFPIMMSVLGQ
ncbi:MAG: prepilin-type N-terminal cleavage/methylation domain-containing protein [Candidatus Binatia bacterium]